MIKIVAAGTICLDITPLFPEGAGNSAEPLFTPGKLLEVGRADINTGGSVSNTGLALAFFGADVSLMGKVGKDSFGDLVLAVLGCKGADRDIIVSGDCHTSYTMVLSPPGIDRIFLHYAGANDTFCYDDLDFAEIGKARLFHLGYPTVMRRLYEDGGRELFRILRRVKELGVLTSLDLSAVDPSSPAAKADWRNILKEIMPHVDFFVPSAEEICFLLDRQRHREWTQRAAGRDVTVILDPEKDIHPLAETLLMWGAKVLMIKCGKPGIYLRTGGLDRLKTMGEGFSSWADTERFEASYAAGHFVSATGAGDTSIAAFLTAALKGYPPKRCLQLAVAGGASCVTAYDALSGLLPFDELEKKIDHGWEKESLA
jgi:sugar/nucleoside kinase (ribokinase family)